MRKILFLFAALIMSVCSAMADNITSLEQVQADALYTFSCPRGYLTVNSEKTQLRGSEQSGAISSSFDAEDTAFQFQFVQADGQYYLYSVAAEKYVKVVDKQGTLVATTEEADVLGFRGQGTTVQPWFESESASKNLNFGGGKQVIIDGWTDADDGNRFAITKVEILDYTVTVEGLTGQGGVSYKGTEYADGATFKAAVANVALFAPVAVDGYGVALSVNGNTVTVTYTEVPTWKSYEEWDVAGKGADVVKSAATGYYAILGWDQQNIKNKYLYDNGTKVQGKAWENQPELVWFAEKQSNGKYTFRNFKTGKYITITSSNGAALNMSENATELNFVFSGETAAIHNGSHGIDVGWSGDGPTAWAGTSPAGSRRLMIYPVEFIPAVTKANVTYDYYFEGSKVASETIRINAGDEYPEPTMSFGGYTLSSKPEGNATADCTEQIQLTWNGPIEFTTVADDEFAATTKWYFIQNFTNGYVAYDNNEAAQCSITTAGTTDAYKWCFVRIPGTINFHLYNKQAGAATPLREQLSSNSGYAANHNQGYCVIKEEGTNDMPLYFFVNGDGFGIRLAVDGKCNLGKHVGSKLSIWGNQATDGDNGSRFTFTEVVDRDFTVSITGAPEGTKVTYKEVKYGDGDVITAEAVAPAEIVADEIAGYTAIVTVDGETINVVYTVKAISQLSELVQGQVYTITAGGTRGAFVYTENGLSSTTKESIAADETSENQQFLFVQKDGAYYLYSVGAHAFINVTGQNANNNRAVACGAKPVNTTLEFLANEHASKATHPVVLNIDGHHVGVSNGFQPAVITHYPSLNDEGNSLRILPVAGTTVDVTDILAAMDALDWDAYMALYNTLDAYPIGEGFGNYADIATEDGEYTLQYQKFMYYVDYNMKEESRYESNMEEMQWFLDHMQINLPKKGDVIRIKASEKWIETPTYLSGNNSEANTGRAAFVVEPERENKDVVWMYDGQFLTCYGTGLTAAINNRFMDIQMYPKTTRIEFQAAQNGTVGKYNIKFGGSRFLYTNTNNYTDAGDNPTSEGYNFELESAADYFAIDYGTAGWASLYLPVDVALAPEYGIEAAYIIKSEEDGYLKAEEIFTLPGFTPAIVKVNPEMAQGGNPFAKGCSYGGTSIETALQGALWKQATPADTYVLNLNEAGNPVFRHYTGTTLGHCKAYYQKPAGSSESVLRINFGEENPTAIMDAIMEAEFSGDVYDLTGRRINGVQNGVFIKNGRKVIK